MTIRLVECDCPICGSAKSGSARVLNGHTIRRCLDCDFQFVSPRPTEAAILHAYTRASRDEELSFAYAYEGGRGLESEYSWTGTYVLERFLRRRPGGSFLDIGAGQGWAVAEALRRGHDAWGYEFGDDRTFQTQDELNRRMFRTMAELEKAGRQYDLLYLSAVIEHVYRPLDFLREWMRFLRPDGWFCLAAVPNIDSIFIRARVDSWDGNIPFNHLNYFSRSTLSALVRRAGGRVVDDFTMGAPVSISPMNFFRQKIYEKKFWGDNARDWRFAQKTQAQFAKVRNSPVRRWTTAALNHAVRLTGAGANCYVTFQKDPTQRGSG